MKNRILLILILFFPLSVFAVDSSPVKPMPNARYCYRVRVGNNLLQLAPAPVAPTLTLTNCGWEGGTAKSYWALGVSNATYEQICSPGKIATGVRHGIRGQFGFYGEYDLWVYCCSVSLTLRMSQEWVPCP